MPASFVIFIGVYIACEITYVEEHLLAVKYVEASIIEAFNEYD